MQPITIKTFSFQSLKLILLRMEMKVILADVIPAKALAEQNKQSSHKSLYIKLNK